MRELTVNSNDAGQRLDKFISKAVPAMPASLMYKLLRKKKIKVNRRRSEPKYMLCDGDTVQLFISEEFFSADAGEQNFRRMTPHICPVYEDENVLLCDKPSGMIVHSDDNEEVNTLINHAKAYLYQKGDYDPDSEQSFAPALCNRIDRNTAGIVIIAKNAPALRELNLLIKERRLDKRYLCAVHGGFGSREGKLEGYIVKDSERNIVTVYDERPTGARAAEAKRTVTEYRVLDEKDGLSLVEVHLITGRTHQIRAQFAAAGHPLLGDGKYGVNRADRQRGYKSQALYSYSLTFDGGERLSYLNGKTFTVPLERIWFLREFPDFGK